MTDHQSFSETASNLRSPLREGANGMLSALARQKMHMKKPGQIRRHGRALAMILLPALLGATAMGENGYETGFETIVKLTTDLHQALEPQQRTALSPTPILLENLTLPYLQTHLVDPTKGLRAVYLSKGCVDLLNYISHAKAIDGSSHGFFDKSMARLAMESGDGGLPDLLANSARNAWSFPIMNRQASHFNQMAGGLMAIELAHVYLGHYQKYAGQLIDARNQPVPLNRVISPGEWHEAVMLGARNGLDCGFAVDGLKLILECIDKMPARPPWRAYFLPDAVTGKDISKINRELEQLQQKAFMSFDK
jgi:hypothetical protein